MPKNKKNDDENSFIWVCKFIYQQVCFFCEWFTPWLEKWLQATFFFTVKSYHKFLTFYIMTLTRLVDYMVKTGYESRMQNYIEQSYHQRAEKKLDNRRQGKFLNRLKRAQLRYYKRYLKQGHKHANRCMRHFWITVKLNKIKVKLKTFGIMCLFKMKKVYKKFKPYDVY
tara:strand:- start:7970 stop:8476 length:507 start_codon:yes stop_codon:yes gene_type:complete